MTNITFHKSSPLLQVSHPRCVLRKCGWVGPSKHNCHRTGNRTYSRSHHQNCKYTWHLIFSLSNHTLQYTHTSIIICIFHLYPPGNKRPAQSSCIATPTTHTLLLQDQPTQKKRPQSQRQHLHRNIRSAIQNSHNKKIQPGTPPVPNVSRFFYAVFYSNLNYM
jgi:hypothetical protein